MKFISFSFYKTYYYFIIYWALELSINFIKDNYFEKETYNEGTYKELFELFNTIFFNLSDLLAGFLVLYTYISSKSVKRDDYENYKKVKTENSIEIELIYTDLSIRKNKYCLLLIISILQILATSTNLVFYLIINKKTIRSGEVAWLISIDILSRIIFSRYFLKTKLYNHHQFALILIIIGHLLMIFSAFMILKEEEKKSWTYFIFIGARLIILAFEDILNKILLTNKFLLAHVLLFWRGIFSFILLIALTPILYFTNKDKLNFENLRNSNSKILWDIIAIIAILIFSFFRSFLIMKVIYLFTPLHVSFLNVIFSLYKLIYCRVKNNDKIIFLALDILSLIFISFSTLIFIEIIIINVFGLNENTKDGLKKKEEEEFNNNAQLINNDKENDDIEDDNDIN